MQLAVIGTKTMYCSFTEDDIVKFFSMNFETFSKNKDIVEKFAAIIIDKVNKKGKFNIEEDEEFEIKVFETDSGKYVIYITKE